MSGWQLGLALFGCWLLGVVACGLTIFLYARHVWRSKVGQLAGVLTGAAVMGAGMKAGANGADAIRAVLPPENDAA